MSRRYAVMGLSIVLALALAVPALGGPSNPIASTSASVKKTANKALKTAKAAQSTANSALAAAGSAQSDANKAESEAKKAQTEAKKAQTTANTAQTTANGAKAAAEAANANANTRVKESIQVSEFVGASTTTPKFSSVSCPSGDPVLGGGFSVGGENNKVTVTASEEQLYGGGWFADTAAISGQTPEWSLTVVAVCGTK